MSQWPATRSAQAKVDVSINEVRSRPAESSVIFLSAKRDRLPQSGFRITVEQIEQAVESLFPLFQNRTVENAVRPVFDAVDPGSPAFRLRADVVLSVADHLVGDRQINGGQ